MQIIQTDDGSPTLFNSKLNEHYHSTFGALSESTHVFIQNGLAHVLQFSNSPAVLEIGFGTGLNALLTAIYLQEHTDIEQINYHASEPFPLSEEIVAQLNYVPAHLHLNIDLHKQAWDNQTHYYQNFMLTKYAKGIQQCALPASFFDVIYFDAFAPDIQPELWEESVFSQLFATLKEGGCLVTYCAKGSVRRAMRAAGFTTERLPGAPGKREMTRATKGSLPDR